jgi:hypothetical protein
MSSRPGVFGNGLVPAAYRWPIAIVVVGVFLLLAGSCWLFWVWAVHCAARYTAGPYWQVLEALLGVDEHHRHSVDALVHLAACGVPVPHTSCSPAVIGSPQRSA